MTSGDKVKELQIKMSCEEIKGLSQKEMDKYWGKDTKRHNFWMRVHNNAHKTF